MSTIVQVEVGTARAVNWHKQIVSTGTVYSFHSIVVKVEISGRLLSIAVKSGQKVLAEQTLMQINPAIYKAQFEAAKADAMKNKVLYEQQQRLFKRGYSDNLTLATTKAVYFSGIAKMRQAQSQLDLTTVKAPFAGALGLRLVKTGDYIIAGAPLITFLLVCGYG